MSEDNVEIVRRAFAAWDRGDYDTAASHFSSDLEIDASDRILNPAVYTGIEGARRFRSEIAEAWAEFHVEVEDLLSAGDEVVALVRSVARGRASGVEVDSHAAWVVDVREQKVTRLRLYRDRGQALIAAGLRDQPSLRRDTGGAMSQENVEFVRSVYAAPSMLDAVRDRCAPDAEFDFSAAYPDAPVLRGLADMISFRDASPWAGSVHFEAERFFVVDADRVLVFVRFVASGEGSGVPVEARVAHEITMRDGRLVRFKVHPDRDRALEAVGLRA
jgi:ketosteroid isomerase-like protein